MDDYGIKGQRAPELEVEEWIDADGIRMDMPIRLSEYTGKFIVIFCFQNWCQGCHGIGIPSLQIMINALKTNANIVFLAIQTVFEAPHANRYEHLRELQLKYHLPIPFGHDPGEGLTGSFPKTMLSYHTGGTPWFILVNEKGEVIYNYFHVDAQSVIDRFKKEEGIA